MRYYNWLVKEGMLTPRKVNEGTYKSLAALFQTLSETEDRRGNGRSSAKQNE
jgi:hypothetical protein